MTVRMARFGVLGLLAILTIGELFGPAPAQGNRFTGPMLTREWRCSKCNGLLGQGDIRPSMKKCPHCGVTLISGSYTTPANQPKGSQDVSKSISLFNVVPFVVAALALMLGIVIRASK